MSDLSGMSDAELMAALDAATAKEQMLSSMSDEELLGQLRVSQGTPTIMDRMLTRGDGTRISAAQATAGPLLNTLNAMTFGYGDEIAGAGNAAIDYLQGGDFTDSYAARKAQSEAVRGSFREAAPAGAVVTDLAGALKIPIPSKIGARTTVLGKTAQAAAEGAGYGAAYGSGSGEGLLDRIEKAWEGAQSGAKWGGGLGLAGATASKAAGALGRGTSKAADQLELSAYGVNKTQAKKAIEQNFRELVDDGAGIKNPMSAAIGSFRAMAGKAGKTSDPSELVIELQRQQTSLSDDLGKLIGQAQAKQTGSVTPSFKKTLEFVETLPGTEKAAGQKLANELISDTLSAIDPKKISSIHQEKVKLGRVISDAAWGKDKAAVKTNIEKRIYADLKDAVEQGFMRITKTDANKVKALNQEIGMRIGLQKSFSDMLASDHTQDIFKAGVAASRTSGGFGTPAQLSALGGAGLTGAYLGSPGLAVGALIGAGTIGAGHLARSPAGKRAIADSLRSRLVRGGLGSLDSGALGLLGSAPAIAGLAARPATESALPQGAELRQPRGQEGQQSNRVSRSYDNYTAETPADSKKSNVSFNGAETVDISPTGLSLIKKSEGFRPAVYKDTGGVKTIGYGHTGAGVKEGEITKERAEELLQQDVATAKSAIDSLVRVELSQPQYDALVSLVFNIGEGAFKRSTLLKHLNAGQYDLAAKEFNRWVHDNGKKLPGLVKRRQLEAKLFSDGVLA